MISWNLLFFFLSACSEESCDLSQDIGIKLYQMFSFAIGIKISRLDETNLNSNMNSFVSGGTLKASVIFCICHRARRWKRIITRVHAGRNIALAAASVASNWSKPNLASKNKKAWEIIGKALYRVGKKNNTRSPLWRHYWSLTGPLLWAAVFDHDVLGGSFSAWLLSRI